jgi:hypothetical protein
MAELPGLNTFTLPLCCSYDKWCLINGTAGWLLPFKVFLKNNRQIPSYR